MKLSIGLSSCPNDIFTFYGAMEKKVSWQGLDLEFFVGDIQELNNRVASETLDCSKVSFLTAFRKSASYVLLRSGSALGMGVGPILVGRADGRFDVDDHIVCPGEGTTAHLLFRALFPRHKNISHRLFSEITSAIRKGEASAGVLIHEGRFTYQNEGLVLIEDLGALWETSHEVPVPLGGLVAKKLLGDPTLFKLNTIILDSLNYGFSHRSEAFPFMQHYAQELSSEVIWSHVELYVNEFSKNLGEEGARALEILRAGSHNAMLVSDTTPLSIV